MPTTPPPQPPPRPLARCPHVRLRPDPAAYGTRPTAKPPYAAQVLLERFAHGKARPLTPLAATTTPPAPAPVPPSQPSYAAALAASHPTSSRWLPPQDEYSAHNRKLVAAVLGFAQRQALRRSWSTPPLATLATAPHGCIVGPYACLAPLHSASASLQPHVAAPCGTQMLPLPMLPLPRLPLSRG